MTGRARALAALRFEETDRVPMLGGFVAHAGLLQRLSGLDPWTDGYNAALAAARALHVDLLVQVVLPKPKESMTEDCEGRDTNFTKQAEVLYHSPEDVRDHVAALPPREDVRRDFPFDQYREETLADWRRCQAEAGEDFLLLPYGRARDCPFMYYSGFGYENYFEALALYPDVMVKLFENAAEHSRCCNEVVAALVEATDFPPFVYIGQDICDNAGPMVSPHALDDLYFPSLAYCLEPLTAAGVKKVWHSDGNINPILERLLGCGIDGFQGLQEDTYLPEHQRVSLERLARMRDWNGQSLILWGSISVREVLPHGTVEDVKRDVERCIDACRGRGGFFLAPTSTVGPDCPEENIIAMYEHGRQYGR